MHYHLGYVEEKSRILLIEIVYRSGFKPRRYQKKSLLVFQKDRVPPYEEQAWPHVMCIECIAKSHSEFKSGLLWTLPWSWAIRWSKQCNTCTCQRWTQEGQQWTSGRITTRSLHGCSEVREQKEMKNNTPESSSLRTSEWALGFVGLCAHQL
jgi:hypothetical protein